jgi:hypothetical protein
VDQRPTGSSVAVIERVDGLELCVNESCLYQRREQIVADRCTEIGDQIVQILGRRRYEVSTAGIVVVPG